MILRRSERTRITARPGIVTANGLWRAMACTVALTAIVAFPLFAMASVSYDGAKWSYLDAKQVFSAASEITAAKYPDSDETTVDKKMVRVYRADGTGEAQDETFTKVLTEKGKRNNRDLSLFYMLPYFELEVVKPAGAVSMVDVAANSKDMIDDSQMSMNIYDPNSKILKVNIPGVE